MKNILLFIDDNLIIRLYITNFLRSLGYEVISCTSGIKALEEFNKKAFDLVLTDLDLPTMTGTQVINAIRKINPDIPIIVLSSIQSGIEKIEKDIQGYFDKDFNEEELHQKIQEEIEKYKNKKNKVH